MSKAEDKARQKALERFPILFGERTGCDKTNLQQERRNAYEKGYHQAEKDLALTCEDIEKIHTFLYAIKNNKQGVFTFTRLSDEQYQEVLNRFNKQKGK
jgi:hypothetical protein